MELEYKWALAPNADPKRTLAIAELMGPLVRGRAEIAMSSHYFDTADGLIEHSKGALRMRGENERSVCCLKLPVESEGGCARRQEFEVEAESLEQGIELLKRTDAPAELLDALDGAELVETCSIDFTRDAFQLEAKEEPVFSAELAIDRGTMRHEGRSCGFQEMEFELKGGDEGAFHALAAKIQKAGFLEPLTRSKLERALKV